MPKVRLTDRFVASANSGGAAQADYFDEVTTGLALRVSKSGRKVWTCIYTSPRDGKRARLTLGTYPATSLAAARGKAVEARGQVDAGKDPRGTMGAQATAGMTVAGLAEAFLADPVRAALRSRSEIERRLRRNVLPVIGDVRIAELRRRDVRNVTDAMLRRGVTVEATRVFEDVRAMVRWAAEAEYLEANPLDGMGKPAAPTSRNRVLTDDEIATLWNGLPRALARSPQCQWIIKLCLITAQRVGEVAGMRRDELDLAAREWRLPGERTKNDNPHTVPLSDLAIETILDALSAAGEGTAFVFPRGDASFSPVAVARTILRANEASEDRPLGRFGIAPWSAHDLRRTVLTGMARLGVAPIVLGHIANHRSITRAGVTLAVYQQYSYGKEARAALDVWAERLRAIVGDATATILPMRAR